MLKEPLAYRVIAATIHCRNTLMAGFTTLRDLGTEGAEFADVDAKRAIDEGRIPGPHLFVATRAIVATSSYGPGPAGFAPNFDRPKGAQEASGTAEMLTAVRDQIGHGADWVKLYADYGRGGGPSTPTFSLDELKTSSTKRTARGRPSPRMRHPGRDAPRGARRRRHDRARLRRHGRGVQADGAARRRVLPTLTAEEAYSRVLQRIQARHEAVHAA